MKQPIERLMTGFTVTENGCWEWTRSRTYRGYGEFYMHGKRISAHRAAYELLVGPIPDGLHLDHLCRNPSCINPAHLEAVTCRENILRGQGSAAKNARKTHCSKGHPLTEENIYVWNSGRTCRLCYLEWKRSHYTPTGRPLGRPKGVNRATHCKYGHPFDAANTRIEKNGARKCRACDRRKYHERKARS